MTENEFNESTAAIFARIGQMAGDTGVAIKRTLSSSALKLEFADGQRIIINHDDRTHEISLAASSGGIEPRLLEDEKLGEGQKRAPAKNNLQSRIKLQGLHHAPQPKHPRSYPY